ncbi:MAG: hypothetical protein LBH40_00905, partial [Alphaproteobacteria bacterium]|nr:hypothetical protein [Alphaproteobacteria bacterium]
MLESITNFFSLSLLELSVYDLVILVLFAVSLILTLVFGLIVIATKVRKLDSDIDSQISKQISNDKAIINYLDVIMNQLSNSKVDLKSNLEIRDNISKQETSSATSYDDLSSVSSHEMKEEILTEEKTLDTKQEHPVEAVATAEKDSHTEVSSVKKDIEVRNSREERNTRYSRSAHNGNGNNLSALENEIKNIPLERKKIINNVVESINTLSALEEVSQKIEERIKQVETQEELSVPLAKPRIISSDSQDREGLNTSNVNINTTPIESIDENSYSNYENIPMDDMPDEHSILNNQNRIHAHHIHEHDTHEHHRPTRFENRRPTTDSRSGSIRPQLRGLSQRTSDLKADRTEASSRSQGLRFPNTRNMDSNNHDDMDSASIPNVFSRDTSSRFAQTRGDAFSGINRTRPVRADNDFSVDRSLNFSNNVSNEFNNEFNDSNDSINLNSERAKFRPLSLNLLNRSNEENPAIGRMNSTNFNVSSSNNNEGQDTMYNSTMNRSGMNRGSSQIGSGMNRPMGGGMSSPMGGMNRGGSQMGSGMNRPMSGGMSSPMG